MYGIDPRKETRREAFEEIKPKRDTRYSQILEVLGDKQMTVREIAEAMYRKGHTLTPARQEVAPRVNEMLKNGLLDIPMEGENIHFGKRKDTYSGRSVTVYERRK